jgi:hypothetical protein
MVGRHKVTARVTDDRDVKLFESLQDVLSEAILI